MLRHLFLHLSCAAFVIALAMTVDVSTAHAQRVFEFEEIIVHGQIQKPEAFYILQHANLNYEALNPKPSFLMELLKTVDEEPF